MKVKGRDGGDKIEQDGLTNDLNTPGPHCPTFRNFLECRMIHGKRAR